jgi:transposase
MGRISARTYRGKRLVRHPALDTQHPRGRAPFRVTHRGQSGRGHVFGAFNPHTGEAFTRTYERRSKANHLAFLEQVDTWLGLSPTEVICVLDNLNIHHAHEVLLFMLAHPRWEFAFIPDGAAYLNLIEPWWKTLRSLALAGRTFETWQEVEEAIAEATKYWNLHRHPYFWGRRRRHQRPRQSGVAAIWRPAAVRGRKLTG